MRSSECPLNFTRVKRRLGGPRTSAPSPNRSHSVSLSPPQVRSRGGVVVRQHGSTQPEASEQLYAMRCPTRSLA